MSEKGGTHKPMSEEKTARNCLKCQKMFLSRGNYNRLCASCNDGNMKLSKGERRGKGSIRHNIYTSPKHT